MINIVTGVNGEERERGEGGERGGEREIEGEGGRERQRMASAVKENSTHISYIRE